MVKSGGEHWVCSVLARHGWGAALTRDGLERTDILAVMTTGNRRTVEIQVKAASDLGGRTNWLLGAKAQQSAVSDREWFVFVLLPGDPTSRPRSFVVPRDHVGAATWITHQNWRTDPSVPPGQRNASLAQARVSVGTWLGYEDRWDLLPEPTTAVPVLLPAEMKALAADARVGLPPQHPWQLALPAWPD